MKRNLETPVEDLIDAALDDSFTPGDFASHMAKSECAGVQDACARSLYLVLQAKTVQLLRRSVRDGQYRFWRDTCLWFEAWLRTNGKNVLAEKTVTLSGMLDAHVRLCDRVPVNELLQRDSVQALMRQFRKKKGLLFRDAIARKIGTSEPVVVRTLNLLEMHNLIERRGSGKGRYIVLTAEGRCALDR